MGRLEYVGQLVAGRDGQTRDHVQTSDEDQGGEDKKTRGRGARRRGGEGMRGREKEIGDERTKKKETRDRQKQQ